MKTIATIFLFIFLSNSLLAKKIDETTAKKVGLNFLHNKTGSEALQNATSLDLAYMEASLIASSNEKLPLYYVFNTNTGGFVIVSADDNASPILGYSDEGVFQKNDMPPHVTKWLDGYKNQLSAIIANSLAATPAITEKWQELLEVSTTPSLARTAQTTSVAPLVQVKWGQSPYYNALCPGGSLTGCVATAMAQIMKYWNYPTTGSSFHSYYSFTQGMTLSANFANTTYNWSSMPTQLSASSTSTQVNAVALLMYQAGISVNMSYGTSSSGALPWRMEGALEDYFGYDVLADYKSRTFNSDVTWMNMLKTEFNAARPVLYDGSHGVSGHQFVGDGYDNNDFVHFNFGWRGSYNGFYSIDAINPGTSTYNNLQGMVTGIQPPPANQIYNMKLYNYVTPSASVINFGQGFSVTTNIVNSGTNTFNGDYCAAVFDDNYAFVANIQISSNRTLQGGYAYTNNQTFSTTGINAMTPGNYYIGIFYRPTGGTWKQMANNGSYVNLVPITVVNPSSIELYSAISSTPATTYTQGTSATVTYNVKNYATTTFLGKYRLSLFDVNGDLAQTINTLTESNGLPAGVHYSSNMIFSTPSITVAPGTYYLMAEHNPNNSGWALTGSSYYQNKKQINVVAPAIQPDIYENNDTTQQAYNLPFSFSANTATINTNGSNLHLTTDGDYYKINLPTGYDYTVTARAHDSYNSGNGYAYTADVLFSYSKDNGYTWSTGYDDVMPSPIIMNNGGTLHFHVAPYFIGMVGSYLFDVSAIKDVAISVKDQLDIGRNISLYPNPAKTIFKLDMSNFKGKVNEVNIVSLQGQNIVSVTNISDTVLSVPVSNIATGVYIVHIATDKGTLTKKLIVTE